MIVNNDVIKGIAHSIKSTFSSTTPKKIVSSSSEVIKSAIDTNSLNKIKDISSEIAKDVTGKAAGLFNKIIGEFVDVSSTETATKEATKIATETFSERNI